MKATSCSHLETHLNTVLSTVSKCFPTIITIASVDRRLASCQVPGALHLCFLIHVFLMYYDCLYD